MSQSDLRHLPWWRYPAAPYPKINLNYTRLKGKKRAIYPVKEDFTKDDCAAHVVQPHPGHYDIVEFKIDGEPVIERKTITKWSRMSPGQQQAALASLEMRPWSFNYRRYTELVTVDDFLPAHYCAGTDHKYPNIDLLIEPTPQDKWPLRASRWFLGLPKREWIIGRLLSPLSYLWATSNDRLGGVDVFESYYTLDHFNKLTASVGPSQSNLGRDNPPLIWSGDGWRFIPQTVVGYGEPHPGIANNVCVDGPPRQANWQHRPRLSWRKPVPSNDWRWTQPYSWRVPPRNARVSKGKLRLLPADDSTGCFKLVPPGAWGGVFAKPDDWKMNSDGKWERVSGVWTFTLFPRGREVPPSFKARVEPWHDLSKPFLTATNIPPYLTAFLTRGEIPYVPPDGHALQFPSLAVTPQSFSWVPEDVGSIPLPAWLAPPMMFIPYKATGGVEAVPGRPVLCPVKVDRHYFGAWEQLKHNHKAGIPVPQTTISQSFMAERRYSMFKTDHSPYGNTTSAAEKRQSEALSKKFLEAYVRRTK